jgi:hypothetical protein
MLFFSFRPQEVESSDYDSNLSSVALVVSNSFLSTIGIDFSSSSIISILCDTTAEVKGVRRDVKYTFLRNWNSNNFVFDIRLGDVSNIAD